MIALLLQGLKRPLPENRAECCQNCTGKQSNGQTVVLNGSNGNGNGRHANGVDSVLEDNKQWHATAFPSYLQSEKDDFCQDWDEALQVFLLCIL